MSDTRYLVTGATGFVGAWVLRGIADAGRDAEVWATGIEEEPADLAAHHYRTVDFEDAAAVARLVEEARPDRVIHLASLIAGDNLDRMLRVNAVGTENLYGALAALDDDVRVVQVGSAAMYGAVREVELPIQEDQPFRPLTPYAISKVAQEYVALASGLSGGLDIVRARIFNLLGPGQPEHLVPATFARQLRDVESGRADALRVGWIEARRDFVDVRDAVAALFALCEKGVAGRAYNVASGRDVSVAEVIEGLMNASGVRARVDVEDARLRPVDVPRVVADVSLIENDTGWRATTPLGESLADMWEGTEAT